MIMEIVRMNKKRKLPTSIGIHGSCVSVDLFNYTDDKEHKLIDKLALRDATVFSSNNERTRQAIDGLKHDSNLHMLWINTLWDGKKSSFMKENAGEYLLIDLVDERFKLFSVDNVTFCYQGFLESNIEELIGHDQIHMFDHSQLSNEELEQRIREFCEQITKIYDPCNVIINRFYLLDSWTDGKNIYKFEGNAKKIVEKSDTYFHNWYDLLVKYLPGCKTVYFAKQYNAYEKNPRGLSPTHPTMDYYPDTYEQIVNIVAEDYKKRRKISCVNSKSSVDIELSSSFEKYGCSKYVSKILSRINSCVSFQNKRVLWISEKEVAPRATRWAHMDKFCQLVVSDYEEVRSNFAERHKDLERLGENCRSPKEIFSTRNFAYYIGNICELTEDFLDYFDIIFFDDMEYTSDLSVCLDNIYKCLRKDGVFCGKTGRTWSACTGNKYDFGEGYVKREKNIPDWAHLLDTPANISKIIERDYLLDKGNALDCASEIYRGECGLNHLFYEDYVAYVKNSLFSFKSISPLFEQKELDIDRLEYLKQIYPGYKKFEYLSLWICCHK